MLYPTASAILVGLGLGLGVGLGLGNQVGNYFNETRSIIWQGSKINSTPVIAKKSGVHVYSAVA